MFEIGVTDGLVHAFACDTSTWLFADCGSAAGFESFDAIRAGGGTPEPGFSGLESGARSIPPPKLPSLVAVIVSPGVFGRSSSWFLIWVFSVWFSTILPKVSCVERYSFSFDETFRSFRL
jgi:hypothetical protein